MDSKQFKQSLKFFKKAELLEKKAKEGMNEEDSIIELAMSYYIRFHGMKLLIGIKNKDEKIKRFIEVYLSDMEKTKKKISGVDKENIRECLEKISNRLVQKGFSDIKNEVEDQLTLSSFYSASIFYSTLKDFENVDQEKLNEKIKLCQFKCVNLKKSLAEKMASTGPEQVPAQTSSATGNNPNQPGPEDPNLPETPNQSARGIGGFAYHKGDRPDLPVDTPKNPKSRASQFDGSSFSTTDSFSEDEFLDEELSDDEFSDDERSKDKLSEEKLPSASNKRNAVKKPSSRVRSVSKQGGFPGPHTDYGVSLPLKESEFQGATKQVASNHSNKINRIEGIVACQDRLNDVKQTLKMEDVGTAIKILEEIIASLRRLG